MRLVSLAVVIAGLLAACSGSGDSARTPTATADSAASAGTSTGLPSGGASKRTDSATPGSTALTRGADTADAGNRNSANASDGASADATRLGALRASSLPAGFELVTAPKSFEFPRDHGPHPTFRHEWWYITGHLDTRDGEPFGFELTFFRFALKPPASSPPEEAQSAWRSRQIYMAHFAVSDINRKQFAVSEHFARDALGLAGAQADPFRVSLDDWSLGASANANTWRLVASDKDYALDLEIDPSAPLMLNGDAGFSRKSDAEGAASYYYSIPRMTAHGKLTRAGKQLDVQGAVWLDREWGSGALGADQQGWDWFALQFDDGSALMFYALRQRAGTRDPHSAGTWLTPSGTTIALANDDVKIDSTSTWTSPTGTHYPAAWHLKVPRLTLDVEITPRLANQELNTTTKYWEGASLIKGTRENKPITGKAYVELVGY